jgi:flagellar protein FliO/FliZ
MLLSSTGESIFQLLVAIAIFAFVLFITYYTTKWISGYQKAHSYNRNLAIVEAIKVAPNKMVEIVKAGEDKYFVIAVGKDEVTLLGELTKDQVVETELDYQVSATGQNFDELLGKFKDHLPKK